MHNRTVVVSQMGARMHYAVPRIFEEAGELERLYTDICGAKDWPRLLRNLPGSLQAGAMRRLAGRIPEGIPTHKIATFPAMGAYFVTSRMLSSGRANETRMALQTARRFSRAVVSRGFGNAGGFYGIAGECLEQLQAARRQGLWTAVEQIIAPREIVDRLVDVESRRFPDWGATLEDDPYSVAFGDREKAEWAVADIVVCPSEFVRRSVIDVGGPAEKCVVVPYGIDHAFRTIRPRLPSSKLRVLTIGAVGLRKGSPYVLEAARELAVIADFRMCGPVHVSGEAERSLRAHVDVRGIVPRSEIHEHYSWADVFLFPTVCEGSATVTYEALAAGLPVVTTPNAGSIVTDTEDGFLLDLGDTAGIVRALRMLHGDRGRLAAMASAAAGHAGDYDIAHYGARLRAAAEPLWDRVSRHIAPRPSLAVFDGALRARS